MVVERERIKAKPVLARALHGARGGRFLLTAARARAVVHDDEAHVGVV